MHGYCYFNRLAGPNKKEGTLNHRNQSSVTGLSPSTWDLSRSTGHAQQGEVLTGRIRNGLTGCAFSKAHSKKFGVIHYALSEFSPCSMWTEFVLNLSTHWRQLLNGVKFHHTKRVKSDDLREGIL